jgi:hypothetical protein
MIFSMRFYILPGEQGKTVYVNFDHVASVRVEGAKIELYLAGVETPLVFPKTAGTLSSVAKGMDISDASKDLFNAL